MHTQDIIYQAGEQNLVGFVAYDDSIMAKRPAVLICHAFEGCNDLMRQYAVDMANKGYVGFAIDMYGDGVIADDIESCLEQLMRFFNNRMLLRQHVVAAFDRVKNLTQVDANNIAAVGFCFGGMCALDLARSGADIKAVTSVHGVLIAPNGIECSPIGSRVLAIHGYQDPQVPPEALDEFAEEMISLNADWELHCLGNAKHAFTDPNAANIGAPEMGRVYDAEATRRSWALIEQLLAETFA